MSTKTERPFSINISRSQLDQLQKKLELATFPDELDDAAWNYGAPLADIKRLVAHWKDGYDWKKHEMQLNEEMPHFKRNIEVDNFEPLGIHYIHQKSEVEGAIPLLFVHGWPGSFLEVRKILPLLVQASENHPSFHVVTFDLPGYGFSDAPREKGFAISQYAEVGHKLMLALGYNEYVTQGGDFGYMITRRMASLYGGKHIKAWHTNFQLEGSVHPTFFRSPYAYLATLLGRLSDAETAGLARTQWFRTRGKGYFEEQSTQPQTLGYSLADSPAGLLAWVYEKLITWTDNYPWEDDEILTWVSICWFSAAGFAASLRIYYEYINETVSEKPATIPQGVSYFPKELINVPRLWTRTPYVVFEAEHSSGGHFAAHEKPNELVGDLRRMFGKRGPAYGVVSHASGFEASQLQRSRL